LLNPKDGSVVYFRLRVFKPILSPGPAAYKNEDVKTLNLKYTTLPSFGFSKEKKN
jgi:hypothetical protein